MVQGKLGKGLASLLSAKNIVGDYLQPKSEEGLLNVRIDTIVPNPYQPRKEFAPEALEELKSSMAERGILQPIIIRKKGGVNEIVAGERRFEAARALGWETIPAIMRDSSEEEMHIISLVENLQREDLNPIEKALAFKAYMEKFGLTQDECSQKLNVNRPTLANILRLLSLPEPVQRIVSRGTITMGHARALLMTDDAELQLALAQRIESEGLSVRNIERILSGPRKSEKNKLEAQVSANIKFLQDQLGQKFGTKVLIKHSKGRGKVVIEFYSKNDFERIMDVMKLR